MELPVVQKLKKELADLQHELTHKIPKDLREAAGHGDLSENAEYEAAKSRQEFVRARVILASGRGHGDASATVEVTPVAPKRWELFLFLSPFLLVGFLWFRALTTRRRKKKIV